MKKAILVLAAAFVAGGVYYLSRGTYPPPDEHVQGSIGGRRLAHGATVCVSKIQNLSGKEIGVEDIAEGLVAQLNNAGFKASVGDKPECQGSVFGEIIALKGKDRVEAEVEFRLLIAGDQTPYISSIAKGKSGLTAGGVPANNVVMAMAPGKSVVGAKGANPAAASREAVMAAFADMAKQIEEQRPSRSTRAAVQ